MSLKRSLSTIAPFKQTQTVKGWLSIGPEVHVFSSRVSVVKDGYFTTAQTNGNAIAYVWFVWKKGNKGDTIVDWIN